MQSARIGQDHPGSGLGAGLARRLREMVFGARAMVQELSGTPDALQDKAEPIGHALELQESCLGSLAWESWTCFFVMAGFWMKTSGFGLFNNVSD